MLVEPDAELSPLRNVDTNQPIEGFPRTPREIAILTGKTYFHRDLKICH